MSKLHLRLLRRAEVRVAHDVVTWDDVYPSGARALLEYQKVARRSSGRSLRYVAAISAIAPLIREMRDSYLGPGRLQRPEDAMYAHGALAESKPAEPPRRTRLWGAINGAQGHLDRVIVGTIRELLALIGCGAVMVPFEVPKWCLSAVSLGVARSRSITW